MPIGLVSLEMGAVDREVQVITSWRRVKTLVQVQYGLLYTYFTFGVINFSKWHTLIPFRTHSGETLEKPRISSRDENQVA